MRNGRRHQWSLYSGFHVLECRVLRLAPCKVIQESLGFRIPRCGFRIPHPWIPDSISGWIPDLKILFFLCTLFSQKKLVLFFCFSSSFVLYKTILGLTREDCKYRPERFLKFTESTSLKKY